MRNDFNKMWGQNRTAEPTPKSGGQLIPALSPQDRCHWFCC